VDRRRAGDVAGDVVGACGGTARLIVVSTTPRNVVASRTRSSASRSVTAEESPASAAARLAAPAAKNAAHSASSGATWPMSTQALRGRRRPGSGRVRAARTAAAPRRAARWAVA
jgi:hypothetical protein